MFVQCMLVSRSAFRAVLISGPIYVYIIMFSMYIYICIYIYTCIYFYIHRFDMFVFIFHVCILMYSPFDVGAASGPAQ